ncbi:MULTISPECIES: AAA family ATPase [Bifidobacterium]|uniref:AAA ATPase domain protein n=3 Tax=Bifidobacterium TaxID=1678 RepID=A0A087CL76_9BIFI|nr:AAA family ATPase [Bifidobacterium psychraerophilum]KFI84026.1 AAA ATPase domain protein [Bifidobacterium psychraerophilum]PKA94230.1 Cdc48 subfamily AAA family protein [Bifidobacterium psychraerophilum DSM 22366]
MRSDIQIVIVDGPRSYFDEQLPGGDSKPTSLPRIARLVDEINRTLRIQPADGSNIPEVDRSSITGKIVYARSNDYASISEHVRLNFAEFIDEIEPRSLYLHNPPRHIREQIKSAFNDVQISAYDYPKISEENITRLMADFPTTVLGQEAAMSSLLASFQTMLDLGNEKPLVLLFIGPSGVGKTETAKLISRIMGGKLMRKQFSMFQNERFASYLFGGGLSENSFGHDLLDRTSNVILLDEFDKANPIFHSAFYQLFDDGEFTDRNYSVNTSRAIIICTSNYASNNDAREKLGVPIYSRFDAIITFGSLPTAVIKRMIETAVEERFEKNQTENATQLSKDRIIEKLKSQASQFHNARSIKRFVNEYISLLKIKSISSSVNIK